MLGLPQLVPAGEPAPASPLDGLCAVMTGPCTRSPHVAVVSAFPAEQFALRAAAEVTERVEIAGRPALVGRLAGRPVVLSLTGIGLTNAAAAAEALLAHFDLSAIVFSGVAGGLRIGDVAVPATWTDLTTGRSFAVDPGLLAGAETVATSDVALGRCTPVPPDPPGEEVCLPHVPRVVVGGSGESNDPSGVAFPCLPDGGEVFGCDTPVFAAAAAGEPVPDAVDMETAAVVEVAARHGVPFLGVRGSSDGAGDPLGLPGFPAQFFAYYRLAADNAAAVVIRLLGTLPEAEGTARRGPGRPRVAAACGFERAASTECRGVSAPRRVARLVSRACALRARASRAEPPRADRLARRAAARWGSAAALVERGALPPSCATALAARLRAAAGAD